MESSIYQKAVSTDPVLRFMLESSRWAVLFAVLVSLAAGGVLAYQNGLWWIFAIAGIVPAIAYFIAASFGEHKKSFRYVVACVFSAFAIMLLVLARENTVIYFGLIIYLLVLIGLQDWRVFLPFGLLAITILLWQGIFPHTLAQEAALAGEITNTGFVPLMFAGVLVPALLLGMGLAELLARLVAGYTGIKDQLSQLQETNHKTIEFARQISGGVFDAQFRPAQHDVLGQSLVEMSRNLQKASVEEQQRNWHAVGIAQIADILRIDHDNLDQFAYNIISHIVKYLNVNQGGLFILNDTDKDNVFLELKGCYAYDRRKYLEKVIIPGEGLVGQAYLEKDIIYISDMPENYTRITSGLGESTPAAIIIVPLMVEEQVIGIMELASFHEIKDYEQDFLQKVSQNVASAIISSKVKTRTTKLLLESQQTAEAMQAQEEELRQNMEELEATQENLQRESAEKESIQKEIVKTRDFLQQIINAIPDPIFVKDREGHRIIMVNSSWQEAYAKGQNVIGKNDFDLFPEELARQYYEDEEKLFLERADFTVEEKGLRGGKEIFNITKKRVIANENGEMFLVGINHDITNRKQVEQTLAEEKYLMEALMAHSRDYVFFKDLNSKFIRVSNNMLGLFKVQSQQELVGRSDFDFFTEEHAKPAFEAEQEIIRSEVPVLDLIEKETWEDGSISWVSTSKFPLRDLAGTVVGTFGLSRNITAEMQAEQATDKG